MNLFRPARTLPLLLAATLGAGCHQPQPTTTMNAPPAKDQTRVGQFFAQHKDQSLMADMSIADMHFVNNTALLTGVGEARLERYAELLATTGGTLHYETHLEDSQLLGARLRTAREFLMQASTGSKPVHVALGMPAARGMTGGEAAGARGVARQPEPRNRAYHLAGAGGKAGGGS